MSLRRTIEHLRRDVLSPRHARRFGAARRRHEALAAYEGFQSVLEALAASSPDYGEAEALSRVLLAEHQAAPGSGWSSALIVAYAPMLSRVRRSIRGDAMAPEDLDQLVLTSFLSFASEYRLQEWRDWTAVRLRQHTRRRVFKVLEAEQEAQRRVELAPPEALEDVAPPPVPEDRPRRRPTNATDAADAVWFLVSFIGDRLDGETVDLLAATLVCGRSLPRFFAELLSDLPDEERRRTYQRVKRRHSRFVASLRPALTPLRRRIQEGHREPDLPS